MKKKATGGDRTDKAAIQRAASELGRMGGAARAKALSPERRSEIARQAAATRWRTKPEKKP